MAATQGAGDRDGMKEHPAPWSSAAPLPSPLLPKTLLAQLRDLSLALLGGALGQEQPGDGAMHAGPCSDPHPHLISLSLSSMCAFSLPGSVCN